MDKPLIALVDDSADIIDALSEALRDRDYRVMAFRNGQTALHALELGETPSLIVLDLMMPEMDGWTFRVQQRASAKLKDVPLVVMSASASAQAQAIHADAFLRKPLSLDQLCAVIQQTLAAAERRTLAARGVEMERLRSLGVLVASVAHEINNPLGYVGGNIELAARACTRASTAPNPHEELTAALQCLEDAHQGTLQIAEMVKALLAFSRVEEDQLAQSADLTRALEGAIRLVSPYAKSKAKLSYTWPELPRVRGHEARLCQVFLNLLLNAVQAMPPGPSERNLISITARQDREWVRVEVADNGSGINEEDVPRIFGAFFTTKPLGEGTGIGLSFCKETVELAGGSIFVRSRLGVGSIFTVSLPLAAAEHQLKS